MLGAHAEVAVGLLSSHLRIEHVSVAHTFAAAAAAAAVAAAAPADTLAEVVKEQLRRMSNGEVLPHP